MYTHTYIYTHSGVLLCQKKKNVTICSNVDGLGGIMVSEIRQTEKQILYDIMCMWNLKTTI